MAEKNSNEVSSDNTEKQLEAGIEDSSKTPPVLSQDAKALGGLRTVDAGLSADEVIRNENFDRRERHRILRKVDYRLVPLLGFIYLYVPLLDLLERSDPLIGLPLSTAQIVSPSCESLTTAHATVSR